MAPIEPDLSNSNRLPIVLFLTYLSTTSFLIYTIVHGVLIRAHRALPPSQATRFREGTRRKHVEIFAGLAFVSLTFAIFYGYRFLKLSYEIWAYEREEVVPSGLWGQHGVFSSGMGRLKLGRWMHDTDLLAELWEVAMEKTRRRWWTQQLLLATGPWSLYVAIQGRRRNIPYLWAFVGLAPLTSVSFSMNLFFLAMLWTPVPLPEATSSAIVATKATPAGKHSRKVSKSAQHAAEVTASTTESLWSRVSSFIYSYIPPKPADWVPHPLVYVFPLIINAADTLLLTLASNTPSFRQLLRDTILTAAYPLILPRLLPLSAGQSSSSETTAKSRALMAFRVSSIVSTVFYILQSFVSVIDSDPGAYRSRYHRLYFQKEAERSKTSRAWSAITHVLGSLADHPSVGRVGWDVLVCSISLATWASIRGIEPDKLLRAAGWASKSELEAASEVKDLVAKEVKQIMHMANEDDEEEESPKKRGKRRAAAKNKRSVNEELGEAGEAAADYRQQDDSEPASPIAGLQGDEENEAEWENGAMAWGMMVLGGLATGAAGVLGADVGI